MVLFGATGMVGQGVLRESLLDEGVELVLAVGRRATGARHAKLRELVLADFAELASAEGDLAGWDACIYCLGTSSAGMGEAEYRRVTYDLALLAARALLRASPGIRFVFVSGAGADASERGRVMWARVKGATENALLALPFRSVHVVRPGYIQPEHGIRSRSRAIRALYAVMGPLYPLWKRLFPRLVTTTGELGRALIRIAARGADERVIGSDRIAALGRAAPLAAGPTQGA